MARCLSNDEVRTRFLDRVRSIVDYWATLPNEDAAGRCSGTAFSILAEIDGCAFDLPAFVLAPSPHPDDKEYAKKHKENWFPEAPEVETDIAGVLHEQFYTGKWVPGKKKSNKKKSGKKKSGVE